jgi:RNA polymerase sigma factor (sigma-70 family)
LTRITIRKCAHAGRRIKNHPQGISPQANSSQLDWEMLAREPSPAEAAALNDTLDALLKPLRATHREIVVLTLQGYTQQEIGDQLGCSERTVRRVLAQAQSDLEKMDQV